MLGILLIILFFLWVAGYVHVGGLAVPDITLFSINGEPVTFWNILILLVISLAIGMLPSPFREITGAFTILWVLAVLGIIAFAGLPSLLLIAIMIGLVVYLIKASYAKPKDSIDS